MRHRPLIQFLFFLITWLIVSCVDPYQPAIIEDNPDYLVVNGMLKLDGSAAVALTYTTNINSDEIPRRATNANVEVEDSEGQAYPLSEAEPGYYTTQGLALDTRKQYRLRIQTSQNKSYLSAYVEMKRTPPIDSISLLGSVDGLDININAHDPEGKAKYYKWNFIETWEYNARYFSTHRMVDGQVLPRDPTDYRYTCYRTLPNDQIIIESTVRLKEDRVSNFTLTTIAPGSNRISRKYRLKVQQYALTEEAYHYMELLKNNTEQIGGLFDPLPSQIQGNIFCVSDPDEAAIGFFIATSIEETEIVLKPTDLPAIYPGYKAPYCQMDTTIFEPLVIYGDSENVIMPVFTPGNPPGILGFVSAETECIDCRVQGGVTTKPDFWD